MLATVTAFDGLWLAGCEQGGCREQNQEEKKADDGEGSRFAPAKIAAVGGQPASRHGGLHRDDNASPYLSAANGSVFYRDVPPGHYHIAPQSYGRDINQGKDVDVAPGQQLYCKIVPSRARARRLSNGMFFIPKLRRRRYADRRHGEASKYPPITLADYRTSRFASTASQAAAE